MSVAADPVVVTNTIDLTTVALSLVNSLFLPIVIAIGTYFVGKYVKDKDAAAVLDKAISNSAGYAQATIGQAITTVHPSLKVSLDPYTQSRLQYVLDHAGPEIDRLYKSYLDPEIQKLIAQKVVRQQGLEQISSSQTVAPVMTGGAAPVLAVPVVAVGRLTGHELSSHRGNHKEW